MLTCPACRTFALKIVLDGGARSVCACGRLECSSDPPVVRFGAGPDSLVSVTVYGTAAPLFRNGPRPDSSSVDRDGSGKGYEAVLALILASSVLDS